MTEEDDNRGGEMTTGHGRVIYCREKVDGLSLLMVSKYLLHITME